jgi:hypothetical protein
VGNDPVTKIDRKGLFFEWFFDNPKERQSEHGGAVNWEDFVRSIGTRSIEDIANEMGDGTEYSASRWSAPVEIWTV